ncbi:UNVERIFIED_CONTAM: cobyrinic acid a,c-diamide synthase [Acetivibrio alkalicellulosi]
MKNNNSRIMIAGTNSGCGKTTITCALLRALINRGLKTAAFKCGPDYIDPMFHTEIIGAKSRNLDMFLCGEQVTKYLLKKNSENADISIIEGVMGYYDGLGFDNTLYSSCDFSNKTSTPVILAVNCLGMSLSVVALIKGYLEFYENQIVAVILNNISEGMYLKYKDSIERHLNIKVLGFMPRQKEAVLESRHLGLVTAEEVVALDEKIELLAKMAQKYIDLDAIISLAKSALPLVCEEVIIVKQNPVKIAFARDKAFCFYYEDSLELLRQMGAMLIPFSPLEDGVLPEGIDGLILGGGYPELYLEKLSKNTSMLNSIKDSVINGLPTYAECGGFMYLGKTITIDDRKYKMVGAIDTNSILTKKLQNFGYIHIKAYEDNMFCNKGEGINAHEFHYSSSDNNGKTFKALKSSGKSWDGIFATDTIYAGYPHLHLWGNIDFAKRFLKRCWDFRSK